MKIVKYLLHPPSLVDRAVYNESIECLNYQPIVIAGAKVMRIATMLDSFIGYFSAAVARIFSLDRSTYPATGIQPFEGEIAKKHHH